MFSKKIYLIKLPPFGYNSQELFTVGKVYEAEPCPVEYDPRTYQIVPTSYIIRCDDGNVRKVEGEYVLLLEEWREQQINKIL